MLINSHTHKIEPQTYIYSPNLDDLKALSPLKHRYWIWGLHPWWAEEVNVLKILNFYANNIESKGLIGMGEIGLDKFRKTNIKKQQEVFDIQLNFAITHQIELIVIHSVKAHNEISKMLKESNYSGRVLLHDFSAPPDVLEMYDGIDYYLGIGPKILNHKSKLNEYILEYPSEYIVHETDDSNANLASIYSNTAEILGEDLIDWEIKICTNNSRLFKTLFPF